MLSPESTNKEGATTRQHALLAGGAFSFSCLQQLPVWRELHPAGTPEAFFVPVADVSALGAAFAATGIVFAVSLLVLYIKEHLQALWFDRLFAFMLCLSLLNPLTLNGYPLFERTLMIETWLLFLNPVILAVGFITLALVTLATLKYPSRSIRFMTVLLLGLLPFGLIQIAEASWRVLGHASGTEQQPRSSVPIEGGAGKTRIMWIVFDELDRRAVFDDKNSPFHFPALSGIANEAVAFSNAKQAGVNTIESVPGMTIGKTVVSAYPVRHDILNLKLADNPTKPVTWPEADNLFKSLAAGGAQSGITGWYFPYCRLFQRSLKTCEQVYLGSSQIDDTGSFSDSVLSRLSVINPLYRRVNTIRAYDILKDKASGMASDPNLDFIYFHIPLPHQPTIYDAHTNSFTALNFSPDGYYHNVAAADLFLSALKREMKETGVWDKTIIVISGDHGWRAPSPISDISEHGNIALFVKFPGQTQGKIIDDLFAATSMKRLLLALKKGDIYNPRQLENWVENGPADTSHKTNMDK